MLVLLLFATAAAAANTAAANTAAANTAAANTASPSSPSEHCGYIFSAVAAAVKEEARSRKLERARLGLRSKIHTVALVCFLIKNSISTMSCASQKIVPLY